MERRDYKARGQCGIPFGSCDPDLLPVSYTHLDVYKRQVYWCRGKEASFPFLPEEVPIEATIVGIVDEVNIPARSARPS